MRKVVVDCEAESSRINVCNDDIGRAVRLCDSRGKKADSTGSKNKHATAFRQRCSARGMDGYAERLQQRAELKRDIDWEPG